MFREADYSELQNDVARLLKKAGIPEAYITTILGTIECGERERQYLDDVDMLWARYQAQSEAATGSAECDACGKTPTSYTDCDCLESPEPDDFNRYVAGDR